MTLHIINRNESYSAKSICEGLINVSSSCYRWSIRVLNKHTDLISSGGILAITTCLLAAKIFQSIPKILPRIALVVFNFGGIIWLNVQLRDFLKSCRDLHRIFQHKEWHALIETVAKVSMKAANILITCATFGASVVAAVGFPHISMAMYLAMRPLALGSLFINISTDIRDYFLNERILVILNEAEKSPDAQNRIAKITVCFLEIIKNKLSVEEYVKERQLADTLVRQLDMFTLETFQEELAKPKERRDIRVETFKLFYALKDSIVNKQASTKANLSLIALGYVSMGVNRAFPDSLIEWSNRWIMSILYTDELIRQKLFQADLAESI